MKKITKEQILELPALLSEKTISEVASMWGVHRRTIDYKIKMLRRAGIEVEVPRGPRPLRLT